MSTSLPFPPDPSALDPLLQIWEKGRPWLRCHNVAFGATEFNPGLGRGRFHPFSDPDGHPVPTLYGASDLDGALSETIFHAVPIRGDRRAIRSSALVPMVASKLIANRDLVLAQLLGHGLRRLEVLRSELIDSEMDAYPRTVLWAQALHRSRPCIDGLIWVSRQFDTAQALVVFGDRVRRADLTVEEPPLALAVVPGFSEVQRAAEEAGILIIE